MGTFCQFKIMCEKLNQESAIFLKIFLSPYELWLQFKQLPFFPCQRENFWVLFLLSENVIDRFVFWEEKKCDKPDISLIYCRQRFGLRKHPKKQKFEKYFGEMSEDLATQPIGKWESVSSCKKVEEQMKNLEESLGKKSNLVPSVEKELLWICVCRAVGGVIRKCV